MTSFGKYLDYAGEICLLSHRVMDLDQMALDLEIDASIVGLKINTNKTKVVSLTGRCALSTCINGESVNSVHQFVYLANVVSVDGDTELVASSSGSTH